MIRRKCELSIHLGETERPPRGIFSTALSYYCCYCCFLWNTTDRKGKLCEAIWEEHTGSRRLCQTIPVAETDHLSFIQDGISLAQPAEILPKTQPTVTNYHNYRILHTLRFPTQDTLCLETRWIITTAATGNTL